MKKTAFQMEYLHTVEKDSTNSLLMIEEAQRRGYAVYQYHPQDLSLSNDRVLAMGRRVTLDLGQEDYFQLGADELLDLSDMDVIHVRQHPPFDMAYVTSTYILERVLDSVMIVNSPFGIRNQPEKFFPWEVKQFMPTTLITRNSEQIRAFIKKHHHVVVKPLYGYSGYDIFDVFEENALVKVAEALAKTDGPLIFQPFIEDIVHGNRRVVLLNGEVAGAFNVIPPKDEFLIYRGSEDVQYSLNARDREICAALKPYLKKHGIIFAGIDIIGAYLIEVNITCTGSLIRLNKLYGKRFESDYWDAIEQ